MVLRLRNRSRVDLLRRQAADLEVGGIGHEEGRIVELRLGGAVGDHRARCASRSVDQRVDRIVGGIEAIDLRHRPGAGGRASCGPCRPSRWCPRSANVMGHERLADALQRQGQAFGRVRDLGDCRRNGLVGLARGSPLPARQGLCPRRPPAGDDKIQQPADQSLTDQPRFANDTTRQLRHSHVEQQVFPLPGADHPAVVLHFLKLHVLVGFDRTFRPAPASGTWCSSACRAPRRD